MKRTVKNCCFYAVVGFGFILFAALMGNALQRVDKQVSGSAMALKGNHTVIIDAGHGGADGGASSKSGDLEKDINLSIAQKLKEMLEVAGVNVRMTRSSDISIHDDDANTIRKQKVSDLNNRLKIANEDASNILISIHQNNFSDKKYSGAQTFYSTNCPESKQIAECIQNSFRKLLQPENYRAIKPAGKDIYLLSNAEVPAVIVECGFLSNDDEAKKLKNPEYQGQAAFSICCGFLEYLKSAA